MRFPLHREAPADDVLAGLRAPRKHLPCRLLYDAHGAALFEQICTLPEYYLTRAERGLLVEHLPAISRAVGGEARVVEPGSGAGEKTRMLLSALERPRVYVPIDVSVEQLADNAGSLRAEYPQLAVLPIHADYTQDFVIPAAEVSYARTLVFFPGSTIGNFEPADARTFLARFGTLAGPDAMLLLGADANQDRDTLLAAYDDAAGVTAAFDLNVLAHVNRTHRASFDLDAFAHRVTWDATRGRIEMQLVSKRRQTVLVDGEALVFERGEAIVTEHCYKHAPEVMHALLAGAGWRVEQVFPDPAGRMRLWLARRAP
ncbi:MAG TPA: L-histidine N(alpha)-methyltransferase [Kofleriaceae bacterium]|nr:L-histidine N(alpha)-methyltransferase [Kofleriaceae bacterium]